MGLCGISNLGHFVGGTERMRSLIGPRPACPALSQSKIVRPSGPWGRLKPESWHDYNIGPGTTNKLNGTSVTSRVCHNNVKIWIVKDNPLPLEALTLIEALPDIVPAAKRSAKMTANRRRDYY